MAEERNFRDKLIRAFGLDDMDDYEDDELDETYYPVEEEYATETTVTENRTTVTESTPTPEKAPDVLVLDPTSFNEAPGIVNKLKQNKTVVVNLKHIDFEEGKKIFDFLSGAVYALEGSLNRIAESVFILAPKIITVAAQQEPDEKVEETKSESQSDILNWN